MPRSPASSRRMMMLLLAVALVVTLETAWAIERWLAASRTTRRFEAKLRQLRLARAESPVPDFITVFRLEDEAARAGDMLPRWRAQLGAGEQPGEGETAEPPPAERTAAYFQLAAFVESARAATRAAGIAVEEAGQFFGFATHAHSGPDPDLIEQVHRQRVLASLLVQTVVAARPTALVAVERERPMRANAPVAGGAPGDFFELDSGDSVRRFGVDTVAMRVTFIGQTETLRQVLHALARASRPLVVAAVDVRPVDPVVPSAARFMADEDEQTPAGNSPPMIVTPRLSRFSVTVERVLPLGPPAAAKGAEGRAHP